MKNLIKEEWVPIPNHASYIISTRGKIKKLAMGNGVDRTIRGEIDKRTGAINIKFYMGRVAANGLNGGKKTKSVYESKTLLRLMAETFVPNPNFYPRVRIKNKFQPITADNVEWYVGEKAAKIHGFDRPTDFIHHRTEPIHPTFMQCYDALQRYKQRLVIKEEAMMFWTAHAKLARHHNLRYAHEKASEAIAKELIRGRHREAMTMEKEDIWWERKKALEREALTKYNSSAYVDNDFDDEKTSRPVFTLYDPVTLRQAI